jgi:aminoglycoside phosphotransferase
MGFDTRSFRKAKFEDRTAEVPVPDLAEWFAEGEDPVFVVRALTGEELARCWNAADKNENMDQLIQALVGPNNQEKANVIKEMIGVGERVTRKFAMQLEMFAIGTVDPDFDHEMAVKFAANFGGEFYQLVTKIERLSGQGRRLAKKKSSKQTQQSKQHSSSATSEDDSCSR